MSFSHEDLGIDLEHAKSLPVCEACRKQSDGSVKAPDGTILCGTHYDEWLHKAFYNGVPCARQFAKELREGRYRACWDAKVEE